MNDHVGAVPLAVFAAAVVGMTNIIVDSNLFAPVREWVRGNAPGKVSELLECHQCSGTWCGFVLGPLLLSTRPGWVLAAGCAGSYLATLAHQFAEYLMSKTDFRLEDPGV